MTGGYFPQQFHLCHVSLLLSNKSIDIIILVSIQQFFLPNKATWAILKGIKSIKKIVFVDNAKFKSNFFSFSDSLHHNNLH